MLSPYGIIFHPGVKLIVQNLQVAGGYMQTNEMITIGNHTWKVILSENQQVIIAFRLPIKWSSWRNDPLWHSWDMDDPSPDEGWVTEIRHTTDPLFIHKGGKPRIIVKDIKTETLPVFRLLPLVMERIAGITKQRTLNFFYFRANTTRKGKIYKRLCEKMCNALGDRWVSQVINDEWFYFSAIEIKHIKL